MDMRIAGSGKIPAGEYGKISVSGSGRLFGQVYCAIFSASGRSNGEHIACAEGFKTSGSATFTGDIRAKNLRISGSLTCSGNISTAECFSCSGSTKCEKNIQGGHLIVSGSLTVGGDVEAESLQLSGSAHCMGLVHAENVDIKADTAMTIGTLRGHHIKIRRKRFSLIPKRGVTVSSFLEGDTLELEYVTCARVTGRVVTVGKGCCIDLVQYRETVEIAAGATVLRTEKI